MRNIKKVREMRKDFGMVKSFQHERGGIERLKKVRKTRNREDKRRLRRKKLKYRQ